MEFGIPSSRLETILAREFDLHHDYVLLNGSASLLQLAHGLSSNNSSSFNRLPHLVIVPRFVDAQRFAQCLSFFGDGLHAEVLPHFDVSPYSALYPKRSLIADRVRFLCTAQNAKPGQIFVAPVGGLLQKTLPFDQLKTSVVTWRKGSSLPEGLPEFLRHRGYEQSPLVEDVGQFALRGGILDIFSPSLSKPVRVELFGDEIDSLRTFNPETQRSEEDLSQLLVYPAREILWTEKHADALVEKFVASTRGRPIETGEFEDMLRSLSRQQLFPGVDFLLPYFFPKLEAPTDHFCSPLNVWFVNPTEILTQVDQIFSEMKSEYETSASHVIRPPLSDFFLPYENLALPEGSRRIEMSPIELTELTENPVHVTKISYSTFSTTEFSNSLQTKTPGSEAWLSTVQSKLKSWMEEGFQIFISVKNKTQAERLLLLLNKAEVSAVIHTPQMVGASPDVVTILERPSPESLRSLEDRLIILRDEDFFGKKERQSQRSKTASEEFQDKARRLSFGELQPGDHIVHVLHGLGKYEGRRHVDRRRRQRIFADHLQRQR